MLETQKLLASWDLVSSIAVIAGFCSGLFQSGINFILRIKLDRQVIAWDKMAIAILLSSLFSAVLFYIDSVVFRILDPSVSAAELNRFSLYMATVFILLPFIERPILAILTRFGIFNWHQ